MSPKMERKVESKETVSSLQKNQERWKVISGQEMTPKSLEALGGEEGVELVKSGWEKQKTGAGFDKTGEELEALGGAANVIKLEKLSDYSQEMGTVNRVESGIVDPDVPVIGDRNEVVYKVIAGYEWENLDENEKKLLGDESYIELARSGWEKQSQKDGTGALKSAEELVALTGRSGAGSIDDLVEDMDKMVNYNGQLMENGKKLNELFDLKKKIEEKYNLSQEEKDILNPPKENSDEEPEIRNDWDEDDEKPDADLVEDDKKSEDALKFSRYYDLARKINPTDVEKAELNELNAFIKDNRGVYQEWRGGGKQDEKDESDIGEFDLGGTSTEDEDDNLPKLDDEDDEPVVNPKVEKDEDEIERIDPNKVEIIDPSIKEPLIENEGNESKDIIVVDLKKDDNEKGDDVLKKKEEKKGVWNRIKRFFTEDTFNEPTRIEVNRATGNFFQRLGQVIRGQDLTKWKEYKSYSSLEDLQKAILTGEHEYKRVDGTLNRVVNESISASEAFEVQAEIFAAQAEEMRKKAMLLREANKKLTQNI